MKLLMAIGNILVEDYPVVICVALLCVCGFGLYKVIEKAYYVNIKNDVR